MWQITVVRHVKYRVLFFLVFYYLDWILGTCGEKVWTGFIWLRTETGGGLL